MEQRNSDEGDFGVVKETELTIPDSWIESGSIESTQRNVENQSEESNVATKTEPVVIAEPEARRLMRNLGKPEESWNSRNLQKKLNDLPGLLEDAQDLTEKEDKVLFKSITRALEEGAPVQLDSGAETEEEAEGEQESTTEVESNGESEPESNGHTPRKRSRKAQAASEEGGEGEESTEAPAKPQKKEKAKALPTAPRTVVHDVVTATIEKFTPETMREAIGLQEVGKKDDCHFVINKRRYVMTKSLTNRPFRFKLAMRYGMEFLRNCWSLNGESFIIDKFDQVQSGQHRAIGFLWAEEERKKDTEKWGKRPLSYETVVVRGVEAKNDTVDTIDIGQKRGLPDVFFRNREMGKLKEGQQKKLSKVLAGAVRLVWLRVTGKSIMGGKAFLHSEALELLKEHPNLVDCVTFIANEEGTGEDGKRISPLISLGYAAGLMYLMSRVKGGKGKAEEFWTLFAAGAFEAGDPILALRKKLEQANAGSGSERQNIIGYVIKAFHLWADGKSGVKASDLAIRKGEEVRMGGIDKE